MATFNKFQQFVEDLGLGVHNLNTGTLNVYLSNAAPSASADAVKTDMAEITNENGYTAPVDTQNTWAEAAGTATLTGTSLKIDATGAVGPFQYVVLYNDTAATDPLIGWWDYGSPITMANGESFSIKFSNAAVASTGAILTLA